MRDIPEDEKIKIAKVRIASFGAALELPQCCYVTRKSPRSLCSRSFFARFRSPFASMRIRNPSAFNSQRCSLSFRKKSPPSATSRGRAIKPVVPPQFSMQSCIPSFGYMTIPYRDNGRIRRCLLSGCYTAVQHAALGRNSEGLRCRLTPNPARCEGKLISYWFPVVAFVK